MEQRRTPVGLRSDRPPGTARTVLFVDERGWDCFFQLAAGARRAGFRSVRVTLERPSRVASYLCFDRTIGLGSPADLADLGDRLAGEDVVDVQVVETLANGTFDGLLGTGSTTGVDRLSRRTVAADKLAVAERLAEAGCAVPRWLPGAGATAAGIVDELGLPVVSKVRTGSGGQGVAVLRTRDEVGAALRDGADSPDHFFERFVDGRALQFAGVVGEEGIAAVTYETITRKSPMGPASEVVCVDDPQLFDTGRRVCEALGISGLVNINVIRGDDGHDWIHDVNPRVWGSFLAFRAVGVDLMGAYFAWLRGDPLPEAPRPLGHAKKLPVFPALIDGDLHPGSRIGAPWRFCRTASPYLRWVGPRYVAYETIHHLRQAWS
jgi:ATP-grasp domain